MRVVEEKAKLGGAKFRHEEERVMPWNEATSKAYESGFRAMNEHVGRGEALTTMRT